MGGVVRRMRRRKRCLGEVRMLRRAGVLGTGAERKGGADPELDPVGLMHVQMLLDGFAADMEGVRVTRRDQAGVPMGAIDPSGRPLPPVIAELANSPRSLQPPGRSRRA